MLPSGVAIGTRRDVYVYSADGRTSHNDTEHYIYDGRGSVSEVVEDGIVKNTLRYAPFGKIIQGEPKQDRIYGYNGEQYTPQTGLIYLRARNYNPETGTFTSQDTYLGNSTNAASRNRYAYGLNDPVTYQDPSGHISINGIWKKIQKVFVSAVAKPTDTVAKTATAVAVSSAKAVSAAAKKTTTASTKRSSSTSTTSRTSTTTRSSSSTSSTRNAGTNAIVASINKTIAGVNNQASGNTNSSSRSSTSSSSGSAQAYYWQNVPTFTAPPVTLKYNWGNNPYINYQFPSKELDEEVTKALEEAGEAYRNSLPNLPTLGQYHEINYDPNLTVSSVKETDDWWDKTLDVLGTVGMIVTDVVVIAGATVLAPEAAAAGVVALVAAGLVALVDVIFRGFDLGEIFTGKNELKDCMGEEAYETTETVTGAVVDIAATAIGVVNVNKVTNAGSIIGKGGTVAKEVLEEGAETWTRVDTIEDIVDYGTNLGKDGQLFLTDSKALEGLDLTNKADIAKAEQILGLPSGRLTNTSTIVQTEIDISHLNSRLPMNGNEFFIPGGYTSGGAREIVVDSMNIFNDNAVKSIKFFHGGN